MEGCGRRRAAIFFSVFSYDHSALAVAALDDDDDYKEADAAEEALAREDPYLAVEPTREVEPEVSDERGGDGVEAANEAAEARPCGVTDDALGPLVAKVARGPAQGGTQDLLGSVW